MLELDLLGPVRLRREGHPLALSVKKTQALLVVLARGGSMPRARVVALLWPQLDESSGRRNLRRELARLREANAADAVSADADALALSTQVACDVQAFESALRSGQPDIALALWRGSPADGLQLDDATSFDEWWALESERLHELKRRALEASASAHEARGDAAAALQRIETLLADDPLQEQRHRDAMRLLAACGRREAALAQYERCAGLLKAELGLLPMAETDALAASLRGPPPTSPLSPPSPPLLATSATPSARLPDLFPFVGRQHELRQLEAAWQEGRAVLIEGEAGVGKSRLAQDFAAANGPFALVRCRSAERGMPYAAFTRALRALAGPALRLVDVPPWVVQEMARLLPELGDAPPPLRADAERGRFVEACTRAWLALAADNFDAVILDDWHHADAASRELLACIVQRRRDEGVQGAREMLVYRPELDDAASAALAQLCSAGVALHVPLRALPPEAVFDLVQQLSGARHPERFAARLGQATAGNPFFLSQTLRHLAELELLMVGGDGIWRTPFDDATQDYRELPLPTSVYDTVLARVLRLPAAARRVLEAAALAGEPFTPALLAPACALAELDAVLAIEQAVAANLLREHHSGGFAFVHDLVQQAIEGALTAERRRLVHRRLALGAQAAGAPAATVAQHHEASGEPQRAVAYRLHAGDAARQVHALPEAMAQWQQGLADGPTPGQALVLHQQLMLCAELLDQGLVATAQAAALQALAAGTWLTPTQRAEALIAVAGHCARCQRASDALAIIEGLPPTLNEAQQAGAMAARAVALRESGRIDEAAAATQAALALPGLQGAERAGLLDAQVLVEHRSGRIHVAFELNQTLILLCAQLGDAFGEMRGRYRRGNFLIELGELAAAEPELQSAAEQCARLGITHMQRAALYGLSSLHSMRGEQGQALACVQQGWALQPAMPAGDMRVHYHLAFVSLHTNLGELGEAWSHVLSAVDEAMREAKPYALASVAISCLWQLVLFGEQARAGPLLATLGEPVLRQMPQVANEVWLARAHFELESGRTAAARQALAQAPAVSSIVNPRLRLCFVQVHAEVALAEGDPRQALDMLPADDAPGMDDGLRLQALAVRVRAQTAGGALTPGTVSAAQALLQAPTTTGLAALRLRRALAAALAAGATGAPMDAQVRCAALLSQLAASLHAYPVQRAAFLRLWS